MRRFIGGTSHNSRFVIQGLLVRDGRGYRISDGYTPNTIPLFLWTTGYHAYALASDIQQYDYLGTHLAYSFEVGGFFLPQPPHVKLTKNDQGMLRVAIRKYLQAGIELFDSYTLERDNPDRWPKGEIITLEEIVDGMHCA